MALIGPRQWLGLMAGSVVASAPVIAPLTALVRSLPRSSAQAGLAISASSMPGEASSNPKPKRSETMSRILHVSSSPRGDASYSNQVAARLIRELKQANPQTTVTVRDLAHDPLPHIDADFVAATRSADGPRTERQRVILAQSDTLVDELLAADTIVIAAPMINFSVSTTLKSWLTILRVPAARSATARPVRRGWPPTSA